MARGAAGPIPPWAKTDFVRANGSTAVLTGGRGYGQVAADEAMRVAVSRAREYQVAAIGVTDLTHIGRLADYAIAAAEAGMIGMVFTATGGYSRLVAPFGGAERRMSTNPMAVAFPSEREYPVVFAFAPRASSEGQFRVFTTGGPPPREGGPLRQHRGPAPAPLLPHANRGAPRTPPAGLRARPFAEPSAVPHAARPAPALPGRKSSALHPA